LDQIPIPKHVSDRAELRRVATRLGKQDRMESTLIDEKLVRLRAHGNNIHRYRWLLKTKLSDVEVSSSSAGLGKSDWQWIALSQKRFRSPSRPGSAESHSGTSSA
jgi:hypothetical protein